MNASTVFQLVNTLVLPFWLILLIVPKWKLRNTVIYSGAMLLAIIYGIYVFTGLGEFNPESFNSLSGVKVMFTSDEAVVAGWIHYLTFDLLIGNWIVNKSRELEFKHYLVIPCLLLCFMFGPMGYLLFIIIKVSKTKAIA